MKNSNVVPKLAHTIRQKILKKEMYCLWSFFPQDISLTKEGMQ